MVSTRHAEECGRHPVAPITPTTPVSKPVRGTKRRSSTGTASATATATGTRAVTPIRPDFRPPIPPAAVAVAAEGPAVKMDLPSAGSATSAFRVVWPRATSGSGVGTTSSAILAPSLNRTISEPARLSFSNDLPTFGPTTNLTTTTPSTTPIRVTHLVPGMPGTTAGPFMAPDSRRNAMSQKSKSAGFTSRNEERYSGPVDVDEVSLSSMSSTGTTEMDNTASAFQRANHHHHQQHQQQQHQHYQHHHQQQPKVPSPTTMVAAAANTETSSPTTPVTRNTAAFGNWLEHQKEPFQLLSLPGSSSMPVSPPISTRHLFLLSGMTLPDDAEASSSASSLSRLPEATTRQASLMHDDIDVPSTSNNTNNTNNQVSPPLSPLELSGSLIADDASMDDGSMDGSSPLPTTTAATTTTKTKSNNNNNNSNSSSSTDADERLTGLSIMSPAATTNHHYPMVEARPLIEPKKKLLVSTPTASSSRLIQPAKIPIPPGPVPPSLMAPISPQPTTTTGGTNHYNNSLNLNGSNAGGRIVYSLSPPLPTTTMNPLQPSHAVENDKCNQGKDSSNSLVRGREIQPNLAATTSDASHDSESMDTSFPMSPPLLKRTIGNNSWLQREKESFQLEQRMQQGNVSSLPTLEMTETLLEELRKSQKDRESSKQKQKQKQKTRKPGSSKEKKQMILEQLGRAQQVVRVILKGAQYAHDEYNLTSQAACYEAIRHYAELRLEASTLAKQLDNTKRLLKDLYLEWKTLREDMQAEVPASAPAAPTITQDALEMLQQLLSDDESIYKEDDTTADASAIEKTGSFSLSEDVDNEKDSAKAIGILCQEMQTELEDMRSVWQEHKEQNRAKGRALQGQSQVGMKGDFLTSAGSADLYQTFKTTVDTAGDTSPFNGSDTYLLIKIEELTAQIERMQQERAALSESTDHLAQEVLRPDAATSLSELCQATKEDSPVTENWTSFHQNLPIYRVREADDEAVNAQGDADIAGVKADFDLRRKEKAALESEDEALTSTPLMSNVYSYRPESMWRSKRFHASNDSDCELSLPVALPASTGVSFESAECGRSLAEAASEDFETHAREYLQQPSIFRVDKDEDDDIDSYGSLEKRISEMSFNHCHRQRSYSDPSSSTRRRLHGAFKQRKNTAKGNPENNALLPISNGPMGMGQFSASVDHGDEFTALILDPYSSMISQVDERVPPGGELALPRKIESTPKKIDEEIERRPLSPEDTCAVTDNSSSNSKRYARICSKLLNTEADLRHTKTLMSNLQKKQTQLMMDLQRTKLEAAQWERLAKSANSNCSSSFLDDVASAGSTFEAKPLSAHGQVTINVESGDLFSERIEATCKQPAVDEGKTTQGQDAVKRKASHDSDTNATQSLLRAGAIMGTESSATEHDEREQNMDFSFGHVTDFRRVHIEKKADGTWALTEPQRKTSVGHYSLEDEGQESCTSSNEGDNGKSKKEGSEVSMGKSSDDLSQGPHATRSLESTSTTMPCHHSKTDTEEKLLEKSEECDRLSSQVRSLTQQLDHQMERVLRLERDVAAKDVERRELQLLQREQAQLIQTLRTERDVSQRTLVQMTAALANAKKDEASKINPVLDSGDVSSNEGAVSLLPTTSENPLSSQRSGTTRSRVLGSSIRALLSGRRLTAESSAIVVDTNPDAGNEEHDKGEMESNNIQPLQNQQEDVELTPNHATLTEQCDVKICTVQTTASGGSSALSSMDGSIDDFQRKTSMDFSAREDCQLNAIHNMTRRIEELEQENALLRSEASRAEV